MGERAYLWDNLKVILMILVVLTHSLNIYQLEGERWIQFLWVFIMTFTMPLFTMISGYWYKEKSMKQICILYLFPCVVFSIVNYCIGGILAHILKVFLLKADGLCGTCGLCFYISCQHHFF